MVPTYRWRAQRRLLVLTAVVAIAADAPPRATTGALELEGLDPTCWSAEFFSETCCSEQGGPIGCFGGEFTFERCCGGRFREPAGFDEWMRQPATPTYSYCSEYVKRFDFVTEETEPHERFEQCVANRLTSVRSAFRPSLMAGQHFPTLLTPGPDGLMFALPAYDFVVSRHIKRVGTFDPEELYVYKALAPAGSTIVDVGANVGAYAIPLAVHVGRAGLVVAAEPFHSIFQMLTANSAINGLRNLRTRNVGLGAAEDVVTARGPALESVNNMGMARVFRPFEEQSAEEFTFRFDSGQEAITVWTLDRLAKEERLQSLTLLKVDVEGHLKAVLTGGRDTLRRFRPIVVAEHAGDDALEAFEREHGYACREAMSEHDMWVCLPDPDEWPAVSAKLRIARQSR